MSTRHPPRPAGGPRDAWPAGAARARSGPRPGRPSQDAHRGSPRSLRRRESRFSFLGELFGDESALDLAGRRFRDRFDDVEVPRHLEVRQARPGKSQQLFLRDRVVEDDSGADLLPPGWMRDAEAHSLLHGGVRLEHLVYLAWRDLFSASVDELLDPAQQPQVAVCVEHAEVASAEPASRERARVGFGIALVAVDHVWPAHRHLAAFARRQLVAGIVQDRDFYAGSAADAARLAAAGR